MATTEEMNLKRQQAQFEKEQRIRNTPFTDLNREDALLRMAFMQKDLTHLNQSVFDLTKEQKSVIQKNQEIHCKIETILNQFTKATNVTETDLQIEINQRLVKETGWRKLTNEPIETHDRLTVNFTGWLDDQPQANMSGRNVSFDLNFQNYIPDLEQGFLGMTIGTSKTVQATFPDTYHVKNLAGKTVRFDLEVVNASRNVRVEQVRSETAATERKELLDQFDSMKMRPANADTMTIEQLREDLDAIKKDFARNQKSPDGVVYSAAPPETGELTKLQNAVH